MIIEGQKHLKNAGNMNGNSKREEEPELRYFTEITIKYKIKLVLGIVNLGCKKNWNRSKRKSRRLQVRKYQIKKSEKERLRNTQ